MSVPFQSWLAPHFLKFVSYKHACGVAFVPQQNLLSRFDRFLVARSAERPLTGDDVRAYLASVTHLGPRSRDNVVSVVWQALLHAARHGVPVISLPERPPSASPWTRAREPFVLTREEVVRLLEAAQRLSPKFPYSAATYVALFGLLYCTGIRVGEALNLDVADLDRHRALLFVRKGKFGKDRLLPLHPTAVQALERYLEDPHRHLSPSPGTPLFVSNKRRHFSHPAAATALRLAGELAGVRDAAGRTPRPLDLRHTFAVNRLAAWYREGRDVNALLAGLSCYMGHVSPAHTFTYLRAADLLLGEGARLFQASAAAIIEVGA